MRQPALFDQVEAGTRSLPVLGEQKDIRYLAAPARSILNGPAATGMGFWSINPYIGCAFGCAYCYARYAHRYVAERLVAESPESEALLRQERDELPPWLAFERRIFVKREAGALTRRALRSPKKLAGLRDEGVVIGTATDPYQPAERRFGLTRGVLEALAGESGLRVTIITKSPLVTRDVDVLRRIAARSRLSIHMSLITVDRELARRLEPRAPTPEARLRAMTRLRESGIEVGVNVMPVLPGITDGVAALDALVAAVARANVSYLGACALRLMSTARDRYMPFIEQEFPALAARYRSTYAHSPQAGERYREGLRAHFTKLCARYGVVFDRYYPTDDDDPASDETTASPVGAPTVSSQLSLTL
ncbi:MAG TPA: radical SAM protein [Gemmatimonadaceae bacterium]